MKTKYNRTFRLTVLCIAFNLCLMIIGAQDANLSQKRPNSPANVPRLFSIDGKVTDTTPDLTDIVFEKLKTALAVENPQSFPMELYGYGPRSNVVVKLRGNSIEKETISNEKGLFWFSGLPEGDYELTVEAPSARPLQTGTNRMAVGKTCIRFPADLSQYGKVEIHAYAVSVRGRIIDQDGGPVAGAKITGTQVPYNEHYVPNTFSTTSATDGSYELKGIVPPILFSIMYYLGGGNPVYDNRHPFYLEIKVDANGYVQESIPKVPLVTEELAEPTRRIIKIFIAAAKASEQEKKDFKEKELPASTGNTITAVDIVLKKAGKAEQ